MKKKATVKRKAEAGDQTLKCSFCGKSWDEVDRIITTKDESAGICDRCVRRIRKLMNNPDA
jgi:transcription elongation factor Elf1